MCVGFLPMIDAVAGGVLYSRNPLDSRDDSIVINSAWGLPKPVVEGRISSDLFLVARGEPPEIRHREIADKPNKLVCFPDEKVCRLDSTGDDRSRPSLSDDQILGLAQLAIRVEDHYGVPQDVEWAIDRSGSIALLQSRELRLQHATAPATPARDGEAAPGSDPRQRRYRRQRRSGCGSRLRRGNGGRRPAFPGGGRSGHGPADSALGQPAEPCGGGGRRARVRGRASGQRGARVRRTGALWSRGRGLQARGGADGHRGCRRTDHLRGPDRSPALPRTATREPHGGHSGARRAAGRRRAHRSAEPARCRTRRSSAPKSAGPSTTSPASATRWRYRRCSDSGRTITSPSARASSCTATSRCNGGCSTWTTGSKRR